MESLLFIQYAVLRNDYTIFTIGIILKSFVLGVPYQKYLLSQVHIHASEHEKPPGKL